MSDFIRQIIAEDKEAGKYPAIITRFPPEPNGYLHIGHAKSICLNFGIAQENNSVCHLRFDDTNPTTEDVEFVENIQADVHWLGFDWKGKLFYASDYFEQFYEMAVRLIEQGDAYVDSQTEEEIRQNRGTVTEAGVASPYRNRTVAENLDLFTRMRAGEFPDGAHVLRGKIDMANENMKMRDPLLYRIRHAHHYRTGDDWCIYPMYDYAHPLSDAIEGISHSICTLEFDNNRAIYDWLVDKLFNAPRPHQYEFARLNLDYQVMSKRKLLQLVNEKLVSGWDDPRMPTIAGMKRRGFRADAIRLFCDRIGIAKNNNRIDMVQLETCVREDLNPIAPRVLAVSRPLKVVITNYEPDTSETLIGKYFPPDIGKEGARNLHFSREIYIEQEDFSENPPKGWNRLQPDGFVRLKFAYIIKCDAIIKDEKGEIVEIRATYFPESKSGQDKSGIKVKGTIQWVDAQTGLPAEFRLYDRLFAVADPEAGEESFKAHLNPQSLTVSHGFVEASIAQDAKDVRYQFERLGYYWQDQDTTPNSLIFNRIMTLKDGYKVDIKPEESKREAEVAGSKPKPKKDSSSTSSAPHPLTPPFTHPYLDAAKNAGISEKLISNWGENEMKAAWKINPNFKFSTEDFVAFLNLIASGELKSNAAKLVFVEMIEKGVSPQIAIESLGLNQLVDVGAIIDQIINEPSNLDKVVAYKCGKESLMGFFVGQVMKQSGGKADAQEVQALLKEKMGIVG